MEWFTGDGSFERGSSFETQFAVSWGFPANQDVPDSIF
jgi:hypothetical protein